MRWIDRLEISTALPMNNRLQNRRSRNLVETTARICQTAAGAAGVDQFCEESLRVIVHDLAIQDAAILHGHRGIWRRIAKCGMETGPDQTLLADAADTEQICHDAGWMVIPLAVPAHAGWSAQTGWMLAVGRVPESTAELLADLDSLAETIAACLSVVLRVHRAELRLNQLNTILNVSAKWNSTHDPDELLHEIAETSNALFSAEYATIFLWDRKRKVFVGTPAHANRSQDSIVEAKSSVLAEPLVIPHASGIVAQVVRTGEPIRADGATVSRLLDDDPDQSYAVDTRSLLCVPIHSSRGKMLGAFELRNKTGDAFSDEDQMGLIELASHAAIAIENSRTHRELVEAKSQLEGQGGQALELIGESKPISELRTRILRVAQTELPVLVLGENGTGKEVASRMIHDNSSRRDKVFVAVNCAALTESLLESELFGHEKGAFTDAHEARPGKFEAASDGTLFLDEIGELTPRAQAKLLRVLEEKNVMRVGGTKLIPTNSRLIAATNRNLAEMVHDKSFREDLVLSIERCHTGGPSLAGSSRRYLDVGISFSSADAQRADRSVPRLTDAAKQKLLTHSWPGNVRELRNLMERAAFLCSSDEVDVPDLGALLHARAGRRCKFRLTLADATKEFQVQHIQRQIEAARRNMTDAAKRLGLHRSNLYRKMRQLDMPTGEE